MSVPDLNGIYFDCFDALIGNWPFPIALVYLSQDNAETLKIEKDYIIKNVRSEQVQAMKFAE